MTKTNLSTADVKDIIAQAFNGNLAAYKASNGEIPYNNENSEIISLKDEYSEVTTEVDLAEYLDIHFYAWKNRVDEFDSWLTSLNNVGVSTYALVELTDSDILPSPDIDSALLTGQMTVLVPTDKVASLDYYVAKIRNIYAGNPFEITNRYGLKVKAFLNIGIALYDESPEMEQVGECVVVRINFSVQYLTNALTYSDIKFELSLNGTVFYALNYTQLEWANTFVTSSVPRFARPDRAAFIPTTLGQVKSISFFDFDEKLTTELNKKFFGFCATKTGTDIADLTPTEAQNVRIPIIVRVFVGGVYYQYDDFISDMAKTIQNGAFAVTTLTLKSDAEV